MTVRVIADSTSDIPTHIADELGIQILPLYINVGDREYRDGIDMTREQFYTNLPTFTSHPQTSAPGPRTFIEAWEQLAEQGATEIISVHVASSLSAVTSVARMAAEEFRRIPIHIIDSGQISLGVGFQAIAAARAALAGQTVSEIVAQVEDIARRTHVFAALDTLEFMARSGRVSNLVAGIGGFLQLKPVLKMHDNLAGSERVRTTRRAFERIAELVNGVGPLVEAAFVHAHANERLNALREQLAHFLPDKPVWSVEITPAIGAHVGPNTVGIVLISQS